MIMATQAIHARQGSNTSSTSLGYSPVAPGSPTLTNPDMILPDYDGPVSPDRSESPLNLWRNAQTAAPQLHYDGPASPDNFIAGPHTPSTPIIYGNGTMLSDIGEVTEVESTAGRSPELMSTPRFNSQATTNGYAQQQKPALQSSPTMGYEGGVKQRSKAQQQLQEQKKQRRDSIESNSTVTTLQDHDRHFADFDDVISVDDSNFQGDDEESVAESNAEDLSARQAKFLPPPQGTGLNNDDKGFSTVSLSQRAEEILANAKKRLTTMEGNLSRAKTSLHSHSASGSSIGSGTPSPTMMQKSNSPTPPYSAPIRHKRMLSDSSIRNDMPTRSASAMGAAGGYRQPLSVSQSMGDLSYGRPRDQISHHPLGITLTPLGEDEDMVAEEPRNRDSGGLDHFLSPTFGSDDKFLTRSASVTQMRDLKDQMQGLKGKISTLREQARADSMKRRSLQSLRTPSPFTHAQVDQWYTAPAKEDSPTKIATPIGRNPWNGELASMDGEGAMKEQTRAEPEPEPESKEENTTPTQEYFPHIEEFSESHEFQDDEGSVISEYEAAQEAIREEDRLSIMQEGSIRDDPSDDNDDMRTEDGYQQEEDLAVSLSGDDDDVSESGESIYHDTEQVPVSHEDREDAFDYEHFFLHSAMGSFSNDQYGRRGSYSSDDSVETTRGPLNSTDGQILQGHGRRGSADTTTTMDSFATATEGRSSRAPSRARNSMDEERAMSADGRPRTPITATRTSFDPDVSDISEEEGSYASPAAQAMERPLPFRQRASSVIYSRPFSAATRSRPSVSSFDSAGTHRSFPLINKPKLNSGVLTPQGTPPMGSPEQSLKQVSDSLMSETASILDKSDHSSGGENGMPGDSTTAMQQLARDDQLLVERLVGSLGKCVLGLSESGKGSAENRDLRRRIDMARRILEGHNDVTF